MKFNILGGNMYEDIMRIQRTINQLNENSIDYKKLRSKIDDLNDSIRPIYINETGISKEILYTAQAISERLSEIMDKSWIFNADKTQRILRNKF